MYLRLDSRTHPCMQGVRKHPQILRPLLCPTVSLWVLGAQCVCMCIHTSVAAAVPVHSLVLLVSLLFVSLAVRSLTLLCGQSSLTLLCGQSRLFEISRQAVVAVITTWGFNKDEKVQFSCCHTNQVCGITHSIKSVALPTASSLWHYPQHQVCGTIGMDPLLARA